MDIKRGLYDNITRNLTPNKVLLLYGPRQVGKTYLLNRLVSQYKNREKIMFVTGDNLATRESLSSQSAEKLKSYIGETSLLIIDEAHKIPDIGLNLKIIVDQIKGIKVVATGSASFDLAQKVGEPLTGRKNTLLLYPVSTAEIINNFGSDYQRSTLEDQLIFGGYPEVVISKSIKQKSDYLKELLDSYLLRDTLAFGNIKQPKKIVDLLSLLAFQIGSEVSLTELAKSLELNRGTIERYLDLLEKSFILINIRGFSRNLRNEVTKNTRYYFYDNGVRNVLINNFNSLKIRNDIGALWENYIVTERIKKQKYLPYFFNNYFWRTWDKKEIDWIEEREGKLFGYEIRWGKVTKSKARKLWLETYKQAEFKIINQENYIEFIT